MNLLRKFVADRSGATAIEYGLIAALMSVALIGGLGVLTNGLRGVFNTVENNLTIN
ncbi:Flp family type IVb pilin [Rhizobium mesosinicum]|uniref:Flp family type IVb pilin n=1 Tax=Rhizobium mesosinicum TaxID=335017 RepID=A0ABS7GXR4_9HYPH|nr:Flp family type IVb pilin [Rhizobium mesosinicum]MBW9054402.1 Flp family type IVb pilin [Rhizobium mesosinicum]